MPKDRRERYRASPLRCDSSHRLHSYPNPADQNIKEWEEARCPVCMEHPHNSILLICSSYEHGCRPYMCDTSYRHSNCFDQFYKASKEAETSTSTHEAVVTNLPTEITNGAHDSATVNPREGSATESSATLRQDEGDEGSTIFDRDQEKAKPKLTCPLCRGHIKKWVVVKAARCFMNSKRRSCSCETCEFSGTYSDLRKHARVQHPRVRPSEADPERQRSWRRLESQRDLGDILSTLRASLGEEEISDKEILSFVDGRWLTVFFLIRVFRPESFSPRSSRSWSGTSRARSQIGIRRRSTRLWGESYEGDTGTSSRDDASNLSYAPSNFRRMFTNAAAAADVDHGDDGDDGDDDDEDDDET